MKTTERIKNMLASISVAFMLMAGYLFIFGKHGGPIEPISIGMIFGFITATGYWYTPKKYIISEDNKS